MTIPFRGTSPRGTGRDAGHLRAAHRRAAGPRAGARGFALVPALFLIVVLGALAVIAVRVGTGQQQAVAMSLEESRALAAAQAGIEWGAYQSLDAGSCAASTTLTLTEASLSGFAVTVTCIAAPFANGSATASSYVLRSTAIIGTYGQPGYVRRIVSGTFSSAT